MKQLMAGAGVAIVGMVLVPLLSGLFTVCSFPAEILAPSRCAREGQKGG